VRSKHKVRSFAYSPVRRKGALVQLAVALTNNSFEVRADQAPHPAKPLLCNMERGSTVSSRDSAARTDHSAVSHSNVVR